MGSPARAFDRNRRAFLARAAALAGTAFVPGCYPFASPYIIRYRLTLHILDAGRHFSGASVTEEQISMSPRWMPGGGSIFSRSRGNATTVVLGDGRTVTALRRGYSNALAAGDRSITYGPWGGWEALAVLSR